MENMISLSKQSQYAEKTVTETETETEN
jgi:hypothetical protein